ncbi:hypothetical protein ASU31_10415 [Pedobacter ginsenosidimutans]|uniref:DUF4935 domain-containing protein n=1 Tax=Pedobacter ginsenosidimutans TaxID=687842 RepID=A0A0T5VPW8_9SPHI|nr:PIN domain-containing protein [Pedobacter ginsenosidimutans]KRT15916.1 hypothetical protein ASU31_10415 [Pedobacter ginsenosidimutans]
MKIFIDTNVFYQNWHLRSAHFQLLINFANNSGVELLMSDLVCEEVQNKQEISMQEVATSLNNSLKAFNKVNAEALEVDVYSQIEKYNFKNILVDNFDRLTFIPYDSIPQKKLVHRAIKQIKPFFTEDKGYRDTLIWLSLLEYLKHNKIKDEIIFVQANANDFFENNSVNFLPELLVDIRDYGVQCKFLNYKSLNAFLKDKVSEEDHLYNFDKVQHEILDHYDLEIQDEISDYLNSISTEELMRLINNDNTWFPNMPVINSHKFEIIEGIEDPLIIGCKDTGASRLSINYEFELRSCVLSFTILDHYLLGDPGWMHKYFQELEELPNGLLLSEYARIRIEASFNLSINLKRINGLTIDRFEIGR